MEDVTILEVMEVEMVVVQIRNLAKKLQPITTAPAEFRR